jgi:hypothetical protein
MKATATRRGFLVGLGALMAAPAIVRLDSIMPVVVPFHQRFSWEVYIPGHGAERYVGTDVLGAAHKKFWKERGGTADSDINPIRVVGEDQEYVTRVPLRGDDLRWAETYDIPRIEVLKIGDRVVDKRHVGVGYAQIIPKSYPRGAHSVSLGLTDAGTRESAKEIQNARTAFLWPSDYIDSDRTFFESVWHCDAKRTPFVRMEDRDYFVRQNVTRVEVEARHREASAGSRARAAGVFEALRTGRVA